MAYSKKDEFSQVDVQISGFAKSIAHPARVAILKLLADRSTCTCGEMVEALPLSQASVSRHLDELKISGLVQGKADGPKTIYSINAENCQKAMDFFRAVFKSAPAPSVDGVATSGLSDVLMSGHVYRADTVGSSYKSRW